MSSDAQWARSHRVILDTLLDPYVIHRALDALGVDCDVITLLANHVNPHAAPTETVLRKNLGMNTKIFMAALGRGVRDRSSAS